MPVVAIVTVMVPASDVTLEIVGLIGAAALAAGTETPV
jgi:hypothetical protein